MRREQIDAAVAARLVAEQFPRWAGLPVRPVEFGGWDNRTFRLGDTMTVRLPTAQAYAASVDKELTWLPRLTPALPYPIPVPVAAGAHSFHRGVDLAVYDDETRRAIALLGSAIDTAAATEAWEAARGARWAGPPSWFHGDVAPGNLLLDEGRLSAVIDFGQCGVGDPACDLVIAWTVLRGNARAAFRAAMAVDDAMWLRGRGWALWKALSTLRAGDAGTYFIAQARDVVDEVLHDLRS